MADIDDIAAGLGGLEGSGVEHALNQAHGAALLSGGVGISHEPPMLPGPRRGRDLRYYIPGPDGGTGWGNLGKSLPSLTGTLAGIGMGVVRGTRSLINDTLNPRGDRPPAGALLGTFDVVKGERGQ